MMRDDDRVRLEAAYSRAFLEPARALIRVGHASLEIEVDEAIDFDERPTLWIANHGGWLPFEIMFWALAGREAFGPEVLPRCLVHDLFYELLTRAPWVRDTAGALALPVGLLREPSRVEAGEHIAMFPEGAEGNCKPWWRAYETQHFHTGFARLAAATGARILPCAIVGNDECAPVLSTLRWPKPLVGSVAPLPMPVPPLPTRWKVVFHAPLDPPPPDASREDFSACAERARAIIQSTLDRETADRRFARVARRVRAARARLVRSP